MKTVAVLGSTGSIGLSALDIIRRYPGLFRVVGLSAHSKSNVIKKQALEFNVKNIALVSETNEKDILCGPDSSVQLLARCKPDIVLNGISGAAGFLPSLEAIRQGCTLALANKESLVIGGKFVKEEAQKYGAKIIPVDSEHSAIFQCLQGENKSNVRRLILTASGGPFRNRPADTFAQIRPEEALKHPTWDMGQRITIDSATMMNKALEIIEAHWLFDIPVEKIDVVIHPKSIIHSMIEFRDSGLKAQLGCPDMRVPIAYALSYPDRLELDLKRLDWEDGLNLELIKPDDNKFPALRIARKAMQKPNTLPCIMNAADEVAIKAFLNNKITFDRISVLVEEVMTKLDLEKADSPEELILLDKKARASAEELITCIQ